MNSNDFREQFMMAALIADNVNGVNPDTRSHSIFEPLMIQNLISWAIPTYEDQAERSYFFKLSGLIDLLEYNFLRTQKANHPVLEQGPLIFSQGPIDHIAWQIISGLSDLNATPYMVPQPESTRLSNDINLLVKVLVNKTCGYKGALKSRIMLTAYHTAVATFPSAMAGYDKMTPVEVLSMMWHELEVMKLDNDVTNNIAQATNDLLYKLGLTEQKDLD
jgi:hypothetical protein